MSSSAFRRELAERQPDPAGRRWSYVLYDQLSHELGPLGSEDPGELGVVLIEDPGKARRRPYHRQKLAWVLGSGRQFALELAERGVAVRHEVTARGGVSPVLKRLAKELGPLRTLRPAEREARADLGPALAAGAVELLEHDGWLTTTEQFESACGQPPWRMDAFYRRVRQDTGILMEGGKPVGGKYSYDAENRLKWKGDPPVPELPRFRPTEVLREVGDLIESKFAEHPGTLDLGAIPTTRSQIERTWKWVREECLPHFGPYEDAMSRRSRNLFHTRLSPLMNLQRLSPARVVREALELDLPLASKEGFLRQIIGWREFMRHVHEATDGFRQVPDQEGAPQTTPRDASGHAAPSHLGADRPLPPTFWGEAPSGLTCLDDTIEAVWEEGYSHHITRLMVLSNLATLLDVSPRELTDWFWVAYVDAFDWVVEPNVLGMGTFALGELLTTKPYTSGAAYLSKMGDHCETCAFDPKRSCPITRLYWAHLGRNAERLAGNPRVAMPLRSLAKRSAEQRAEDTACFERVSAALARGERLEP